VRAENLLSFCERNAEFGGGAAELRCAGVYRAHVRIQRFNADPRHAELQCVTLTASKCAPAARKAWVTGSYTQHTQRADLRRDLRQIVRPPAQRAVLICNMP
jgi:hypothetical protein